MILKSVVAFVLVGGWSLHARAGSCEVIHINEVAKAQRSFLREAPERMALNKTIHNVIIDPQIKKIWYTKVQVLKRQRTRWISRSSTEQRFQDLRNVSKTLDFNLFFKAAMTDLEGSSSGANWTASAIERWVEGIPLPYRYDFVTQVLPHPNNHQLTAVQRKYRDMFLYFLANEKAGPSQNIFGILATMESSTLNQFLKSYSKYPFESWARLPPRSEFGDFVEKMDNNVDAAVDYWVRVGRYQARTKSHPGRARIVRKSVLENFQFQLVGDQRALEIEGASAPLRNWLKNQSSTELKDLRLAKALIEEQERVPYVSEDGTVGFYSVVARPAWPNPIIRSYNAILLRSAYSLMALDTVESRFYSGDFTTLEVAWFPKRAEVLFDLTVLNRWALLTLLWQRLSLPLEESLLIAWRATAEGDFNLKLKEVYHNLFPRGESLEEIYFDPQLSQVTKQLRQAIRSTPVSSEFNHFLRYLMFENAEAY